MKKNPEVIKNEENFYRLKDTIREHLLKYTRKAYRMIPETKKPRILDIGCGSGVATLGLAEMGQGEVTGIDVDQQALKIFAEKIKEAGLENRVHAFNRSMLNMDFPDSSYDIIWAEGSIAVIGFEKGLKDWRRILKDGGFLAVHDDLGDLPEKIKMISRNGYELCGHFILDEDVWWNEYYAPLEKKLGETRIKAVSEQREIDDCKKYPERFRSVFFIMKKI